MKATFYLIFDGVRNAQGELDNFKPTLLRATHPEQRPKDAAIIEVEADFSPVALVLDDHKIAHEPPPLLVGRFVGPRRAW